MWQTAHFLNERVFSAVHEVDTRKNIKVTFQLEKESKGLQHKCWSGITSQCKYQGTFHWKQVIIHILQERSVNQ